MSALENLFKGGVSSVGGEGSSTSSVEWYEGGASSSSDLVSDDEGLRSEGIEEELEGIIAAQQSALYFLRDRLASALTNQKKMEEKDTAPAANETESVGIGTWTMGLDLRIFRMRWATTGCR